jgi:uncharacterized membrane protein
MHPHVPHIHLHFPEQTLLFRASMWWRIFYGFLRLILGVSFLRIIGTPLSDFIYTLLSHEITGRAGDFVLEHMYTLFEIHDFTVTYFIAGYFIFWGTVDIILSLCLLHHIRQAFPITMGLIGLFIVYSMYRFTFTHSLVLLGVIAIDIVILYLIYGEYRKLPNPMGEISTPSDPPLHQS